MIKGIIFDMDGVVTNTADLHFKSWKIIFDAFLSQIKCNPPFLEDDYYHYLDGMPRTDGVAHFLNSRNILLENIKEFFISVPACINELCERKNKILLSMVCENSVECFQDAIELIQFLKARNYAIALISSSKNCSMILNSAKIDSLFPIRIDGCVSEALNLAGKPKPDIFLEAAKCLNLKPQECLIIEDALSGVKAGKDGNFKVVALDRKNKLRNEFEQLEPDYILTDLSPNQVWFYKRLELFTTNKKKNALEVLPSISDVIKYKYDFVIFLDYDGTLTPIVDEPKNACLSTKMRECLSILCQNYTTVIISGRQLTNLKELINLPMMYYSGNHGFEIEGPGISNFQSKIGLGDVKELKYLYQKLFAELKDIKGCIIEDKKFSLSIHYRLVKEEKHAIISAILDEHLKNYPQFIRREGKKVFEVRPNICWNKGLAAAAILSKLNKNTKTNLIPIYIGDDVTDEDAFVQFAFSGISIKVDCQLQSSSASYFLKSTQEVQHFLNHLNEIKRNL